MTNDVVELILADHREMKRMFETLRTDREARTTLVPVLTTLLTAHEKAEESEVYPAARTEAGETEEVEHSQEEHLLADRLMEELAGLAPQSDEFDAKLTELVEAVEHHLEEEEETVLPGMREHLSDERRAELGEAFLQVRAEHLGDQVTDTTKTEWAQKAENIEMPVGDRSKQDLKEALYEQADE